MTHPTRLLGRVAKLSSQSSHLTSSLSHNNIHRMTSMLFQNGFHSRLNTRLNSHTQCCYRLTIHLCKEDKDIEKLTDADIEKELEEMEKQLSELDVDTSFEDSMESAEETPEERRKRLEIQDIRMNSDISNESLTEEELYKLQMHDLDVLKANPEMLPYYERQRQNRIRAARNYKKRKYMVMKAIQEYKSSTDLPTVMGLRKAMHNQLVKYDEYALALRRAQLNAPLSTKHRVFNILSYSIFMGTLITVFCLFCYEMYLTARYGRIVEYEKQTDKIHWEDPTIWKRQIRQNFWPWQADAPKKLIERRRQLLQARLDQLEQKGLKPENKYELK